MKKILFFAGIAVTIFTQAQNPSLFTGQSYRIHPGNVSQTETFIAKSPVDQNTFFVGCNTINFIPFFISEGVYSTNDAGMTWSGSDTCKGNPEAYHGGDPGITIDRNGRFIITRLGRTPFVGLYSHYSDDQGRTWSAQKAVSTDDLERAVLLSDSRAGDPGYGRTYAVWIKFAYPFPLMFAYTDDGAVTWSTPRPVNNPPIRSAGGDLALGPDGTLYACWAGVTDVSPFKEISVGFAKSSDAGNTWDVNENAYAVNGITGVLSNKNNIRVNGLPLIAVDTTNGPRRGWIYIVSGQKSLAPAGDDPDIILNRSEDGGQTWSAGIRVNQDALNNGKTQYFPAIHVDSMGAVGIIFYDDRNTTNDSAGVFLARSFDGGDTWTEFEICDHHFKPAPIGGLGQGYQGDNIDLSSTSKELIPVWMDNSTGIYQLWTNPLKFSEITSVEDHALKTSEHLHCSPNPSSGTVKISYKVEASGNIIVEILDENGKLISTPATGNKKTGEYSVFFNEDKRYTSGIYFCRFKTERNSETVKIVIR